MIIIFWGKRLRLDGLGLGLLEHLVDVANHVEGVLWDVIELTLIFNKLRIFKIIIKIFKLIK